MSATAAAQQAIPKAFPKFLYRYVGNERLFRCLQPYEKYSVVAYLNSAYNVAPIMKASLSVVPLYGIFVGNPPAEKIDFNSSAALTVTGLLWFVYVLLITPQNTGTRALSALNFGMACVNGVNCYRYLAYRKSKALEM
ncbi:putative mitochondrial pyruvate carrier protein [Trypanosoma conorhini]|uniref:Mitochondrial pyruvate carrier n=1 Tax=Trypanosoma conorhini TaxID=83891 RepID=A0A3S5IUN6_9TRYP|nr:putative mitochondrial pyruvate carrier protein [Trypanosoma conorhini]RNF26969.1 putative mitochondrial pyruvate carrier protein [Trypanosoma conorhini]